MTRLQVFPVTTVPQPTVSTVDYDLGQGEEEAATLQVFSVGLQMHGVSLPPVLTSCPETMWGHLWSFTGLQAPSQGSWMLLPRISFSGCLFQGHVATAASLPSCAKNQLSNTRHIDLILWLKKKINAVLVGEILSFRSGRQAVWSRSACCFSLILCMYTQHTTHAHVHTQRAYTHTHTHRMAICGMP